MTSFCFFTNQTWRVSRIGRLLLSPLMDALELEQAFSQRLFARHRLDTVKLTDHVERFPGPPGRMLLRLECLVELASHVRHAAKM